LDAERVFFGFGLSVSAATGLKSTFGFASVTPDFKRPERL
jgi:hypothetical protein